LDQTLLRLAPEGLVQVTELCNDQLFFFPVTEFSYDVVYKVKWRGDWVAVKALTTEGDEKKEEGLRGELSLMADLRSPYIVYAHCNLLHCC